ncbi:MAG: hypothetical protein ACYS26_03145 [Planctomycetota bacterium]|jgi:hypothetical protein
MATSVRIAQGTFFTACLVGGLSLWLWAPWEQGSASQSDRSRYSRGPEAASSEWQVGEVRDGARRAVFGVVQDVHGLPIPGVRVEFRAPFDPEFTHAVPAHWIPDASIADSEAEPDQAPRSTARSASHSNSERADEESIASAASGLEGADDRGRFAIAITNARGEFQLPDVPTLEGGLLHYGLELFEGDPLTQPVQPGDEPQVLVLPA